MDDERRRVGARLSEGARVTAVEEHGASVVGRERVLEEALAVVIEIGWTRGGSVAGGQGDEGERGYGRGAGDGEDGEGDASIAALEGGEVVELRG